MIFSASRRRAGRRFWTCILNPTFWKEKDVVLRAHVVAARWRGVTAWVMRPLWVGGLPFAKHIFRCWFPFDWRVTSPSTFTDLPAAISTASGKKEMRGTRQEFWSAFLSILCWPDANSEDFSTRNTSPQVTPVRNPFGNNAPVLATTAAIRRPWPCPVLPYS